MIRFFPGCKSGPLRLDLNRPANGSDADWRALLRHAGARAHRRRSRAILYLPAGFVLLVVGVSVELIHVNVSGGRFAILEYIGVGAGALGFIVELTTSIAENDDD